MEEVRASVREFLLDFKTQLEGKTRPIGPAIVHTIASFIEEIANSGEVWFFEKYTKEKSFLDLFSKWLNEHGFQEPKNDLEAKSFLKKLAMEQAYTITLKLMFYHVLRLKYESLSGKLSDFAFEGEITPDFLKRLLDSLFKEAVTASGDFQVVFDIDLVDSLELPKYSISKFMMLFNFLREVDWRSLDYDIIGTILEDMIYKERRHLLGQYFTRPEVVDLILAFTLKKVGFLLDPCVGSGTFLVRAYQRMRYLDLDLSHSELVSKLVGLDVDKNVAMLAAINLYIRDPLTVTVAKPKISRIDFFADMVRPYQTIKSLPQQPREKGDSSFEFELPVFNAAVANPPYTRQEEMKSAFYSSEYKSRILENAIKAIKLSKDKNLQDEWSAQASIYAYFLVKSAEQFVQDEGRIGFITSNSWLFSSFGVALKKYLLKYFRILAVIESSVERWFEDADINTAILILEKIPKNQVGKRDAHEVKFVSLNTTLSALIGRSPSGFDKTETRNYWATLDRIISCIEDAPNSKLNYLYYGQKLNVAMDNERMRIVKIPQRALKAEDRWEIYLRGPDIWFEVLSQKGTLFKEMKKTKLIRIERGFTTNANELYYLPSKHWRISSCKENSYHILKGRTELILPKSIVKPVVKSPTSLKKYTVEENNLKRLLIYLQCDKSAITEKPVIEYINWMEKHVASEFLINEQFPTLACKLFKPELAVRLTGLSKSTKSSREPTELKSIAKDFLEGKSIKISEDWFKLPSRKAAHFLCVPGIAERFAFYQNNIGALVDKRLYGVYLDSEEIPFYVFFAILNSTISFLAVELFGRTELGLGALDLAVEDYEETLILDAKKVWSKIEKDETLKKHLSDIVANIEGELVLPINKEILKESHKSLDRLVLGEILGLTPKQILDIQNETAALVDKRISRARTVDLHRRGKPQKRTKRLR